MEYLFIIGYAATLFYFTVTDRVKKYIMLLFFQGVILSGITFFHLTGMETINMIFIIFETVAVKAFIIPLFLMKIRKRNNIVRLSEKTIPAHYSLVIVFIVIISSFLLSNTLQDLAFIHTKYFSIAIAAFFAGLYFIIIHKNVFMNLIGYMIIENGVFLLSLAVSQEKPILIDMAILMDLLAGVMILGMFINHIGNTFKSASSEYLTQLKE